MRYRMLAYLRSIFSGFNSSRRLPGAQKRVSAGKRFWVRLGTAWAIALALPGLMALVGLPMGFTAMAQAQTAAQTTAQTAAVLRNQAVVDFDSVLGPLCTPTAGTSCPAGESTPVRGQVSSVVTTEIPNQLIDPLGQITGCAGEVLSSYEGFSVGLYEADPADPSGVGFRGLVALTQTEVPDNPNNRVPGGLRPNAENSNPFALVNSDRGTYNFLFDLGRGQLDAGRTYILVVNPPANSVYSQRRVRIVIGTRQGNTVSYTATSLDGKPLSTTDDRTTVTSSLTIRDGAQTGLVLTAFSLNTTICQAQEIQIIKTGDRAAASPGDTVIYRLAVRNLASAALDSLRITDVLPLGFRFREGSVRAEFRGTSLAVTATANGTSLTFDFPALSLPPANRGQSDVLTIAYAALLTPDAIRGSGQNSASVVARRSDNRRQVADGPALHRLRIRNGIISDCGTLIGRVFDDKNFDGEQQPGEPGIPNAVIFLDDGNRITTDVNGLYSVANVLPGRRTGVLDLTSIPDYTLAPNLKFSERNSQSRLVHMAPGSLVRMNFAVTPALKEVGK
jgi:uncharacterized repeat protein (TIGR01451 family)